MSTKYRSSRDVPLDVIIDRLEELSDAVTGGHEIVNREFCMRIPAECDYDADLVISEAASRLKSLMYRTEQLETMVKVFLGCIETGAIPAQGSPCHNFICELVGGDKQ